ncbi:MAG: NDP-sugar synthase [Gemmatimonadaceae bacterium]|nr:NDP-sugar synthase [Gemmatimonadaceae bacterium]
MFERVLRGPLLPVAQTPLIKYPLQWLSDAGIGSAVLCANSATPAVRALLGSGASMQMAIDYYEDKEPRGPAGCARDAVAMTTARTFVVIEGTIVPTLDFGALLAAHRQSGAAATVVVEYDRRRRGMASGVRRQPAGIYLFERRALEAVSAHGYQDIKEGLLGRLNAAGERVAMHEVHGLSARVLDYSSYAAVSRWLVTRSIERPSLLPEYVRNGEGLQHPTAVVDPSARIVGPVVLGPGVRIEADAVLVGPASIGDRSIVSARALVSRSFIWDDCVVGPDALIDSSVLADHSIVLPGDRLRGITHVPEQFSAPEPGDAAPTAAAPGLDVQASLEAVADRIRVGIGATRMRGEALIRKPRNPSSLL